MHRLYVLVAATMMVACSAKPKQCDPVGCSGSVTYATTVTFTDRRGDFSFSLCRNRACGTTTFTSSSATAQTVPLVAPFSGTLTMGAPASTTASFQLALEGDEVSFAQGDVWELTFVDVTRSATLLHVIGTPTSYTLNEPAGAGCGGCLSGTIVPR